MSPTVHDRPLAQLRGSRKRYGATQALDGVDLSLQRGEVLALLGANGAGKSTAIALLLGLLAADEGSAELFGCPPGDMAVRRRMGVMLQSAGIPENSRVCELLDLTRSYYPFPRSVADCVALAGLEGLMERRYGRLSGGQQRRVQFALAICGNPEVLFLDEPTTGLDIDARQRMWATIRQLVADGVGILLTTHYLEEAEELCDRIAIINHGKLIANKPTRELVDMAREKIVVLTLDRDVAQAPQHESFAKCISTGPRQVEITYDKDRVTAGEVMSLVQGQGYAIVDVSTREADLEDVFVSLTSKPRD